MTETTRWSPIRWTQTRSTPATDRRSRTTARTARHQRCHHRSLGPVKISGSRVLLTGATGGLGRAIAQALDQRGAHLLLTARRQEALEGLAAELRSAEVVAA